MGLDGATLKGMASMVKAMLPYEYDYEPTTKQARCLHEIAVALTSKTEKFKEYEGFLGHIIKQTDLKNDSKVDDVIMVVRDIILSYYPNAEPVNITFEEKEWDDPE